VVLDVAAHLSRVILEPPRRGVEGVANGDIDVLMRVIEWACAIHHHVLARHADIDAHVIQLALVMVAVRRLHHDAAADDAVVEAFELRRLLADALLDGGGGSMLRKLICSGICMARLYSALPI
jgi:hypothetical protein